MFGDLYKKANEKIPTEEAKKRLLAKLETPQIVPVKRKKVVYKRYAALAACFILCIAVVGIFESYKKETPPVMPRVAEPIRQTEKKLAEEDSISLTADETKASVARSQTTYLYMNFVDYDSLGEASLEKAAAENGKVVTKAEYAKYIGKDIEAEILVPEDFLSITKDEEFLETDSLGNFVDDEWNFVYNNGDDEILVVTTKNTEDIEKTIKTNSYKNSNIAGYDAVLLNSGEVYKGYMVSGDIGYKVTAKGINENELVTLLESIAE